MLLYIPVVSLCSTWDKASDVEQNLTQINTHTKYRTLSGIRTRASGYVDLLLCWEILGRLYKLFCSRTSLCFKYLGCDLDVASFSLILVIARTRLCKQPIIIHMEVLHDILEDRTIFRLAFVRSLRRFTSTLTLLEHLDSKTFSLFIAISYLRPKFVQDQNYFTFFLKKLLLNLSERITRIIQELSGIRPTYRVFI